jgi:hypothetical protein
MDLALVVQDRLEEVDTDQIFFPHSLLIAFARPKKVCDIGAITEACHSLLKFGEVGCPNRLEVPRDAQRG